MNTGPNAKDKIIKQVLNAPIYSEKWDSYSDVNPCPEMAANSWYKYVPWAEAGKHLMPNHQGQIFLAQLSFLLASWKCIWEQKML